MLKKEYRLCKRFEFRCVYQRGNAVKNRNFVLYYRPNRLGKCRIGFSVSKKIGKAVVRNRVKRCLREACRLHLTAFAKGYDYVFIARLPIRQENTAALGRQIQTKLAELALQPCKPKQNHTVLNNALRKQKNT